LSAVKKAVDDNIQSAIDDIKSTYGDGVIGRMDDERNKVEVIPTGILTLDKALGSGGIPRGRVSTFYGPYGGGKSTLLMHTVAEEQRLGGLCAIIDMEYGIDPVYARAIGVNIADCYISQPDTGNDAFGIIDKLIKHNACSLIVVDSAAAMVPRAELEGDFGDAHVGLQARLFSQALRKLVGPLGRSNTALVFTNQVREKVGVIYGSPETQPAGRALPFYSSVLIEIRRSEAPVKEMGMAVSNRVKFKIPKNRVGKPYQEAEADITYGEGFSRTGSLLDVAVDMELVKKSGSWFTYEGEQLGQGRAKSKEFLAENESTRAEIEKRVREAL